MTDISGDLMADLFAEWAKREGLLSRITEEQCRDLAKAFMAGFLAAEAQRRQPGRPPAGLTNAQRRAWDAGDENWQQATGIVGASSTADGFTDVQTRVIPEGVLQVTNHYAAIMVDDPLPKVIGWQCYRRETALNGEPVLDPLRAQELADKAGIETPGPIKMA